MDSIQDLLDKATKQIDGERWRGARDTTAQIDIHLQSAQTVVDPDALLQITKRLASLLHTVTHAHDSRDLDALVESTRYMGTHY